MSLVEMMGISKAPACLKMKIVEEFYWSHEGQFEKEEREGHRV